MQFTDCLRGILFGGKMNIFIAILILLLPIGFYFGWLLREKLGHDKIAKAQAYCENLILESKEEAENLQKENFLKLKSKFLR